MYAVYSAYLVTVLLYELAVTGYGALYLWPDIPWLMSHAYEVFACASFLSATVFFRVFLGLHQARPAHLRRLNSVIIGYWVFALAVAVLWPNRVLSASIAMMGLLASLFGVYTSVVLIAQGNRFARYFGLAWAVVIAGTLGSLLSLLGVIEGNVVTNNAQHIGFVLEVLLLSIALADRIKRNREARDAAQREALQLTERVREEREEKIQAQAHAIELQARANEDLELRVLDRTAELERAMKNLEFANIELAKLSVTDALTKVHNRRYFDEVMDKEYARSERTQVPLAVVLVDIDHFKRVNDTCGHLAGDECLRLVATALRQTAARSTDLVARYGGEEFALVLPGTDADQAVELADRVRQAVEDIDFIYRGKRVPLSVSLGVVARVTSLEQPMADFIAEADAALYRAKEAGRNRVVRAA
jgi:diguanylate cyclase (GGDEF)-like protein